jgi:hypothetical protein
MIGIVQKWVFTPFMCKIKFFLFYYPPKNEKGSGDPPGSRSQTGDFKKRPGLFTSVNGQLLDHLL